MHKSARRACDERLLQQATQTECKVRVSASVAAPAHVGLSQSIEAKAVAKRRHKVPGPSVGACVLGSSLVLLTCAVPCFWLPAATARGESASATHPFQVSTCGLCHRLIMLTCGVPTVFSAACCRLMSSALSSADWNNHSPLHLPAMVQ
jgi:hypothetical protein